MITDIHIHRFDGSIFLDLVHDGDGLMFGWTENREITEKQYQGVLRMIGTNEKE